MTTDDQLAPVWVQHDKDRRFVALTNGTEWRYLNMETWVTFSPHNSPRRLWAIALTATEVENMHNHALNPPAVIRP